MNNPKQELLDKIDQCRDDALKFSPNNRGIEHFHNMLVHTLPVTDGFVLVPESTLDIVVSRLEIIANYGPEAIDNSKEICAAVAKLLGQYLTKETG